MHMVRLYDKRTVGCERGEQARGHFRLSNLHSIYLQCGPCAPAYPVALPTRLNIHH